MYLANINDLKDGLNWLIVEGHKFFIYKDEDNIIVYDSICPHQGATLHCDKEERIYCKVHNWCFNAKSGTSHNIKNAKLFTHNTKLIDGKIYLDNYTKKNKTLPPPPIVMIVMI